MEKERGGKHEKNSNVKNNSDSDRGKKEKNGN